MSKTFWKNKKVLITGVNGFVGAHLYNYLLGKGAKVIGVTKRKSIDKNMRQIDVTNLKHLEKEFMNSSIFACFHLAGESIVEHGQQSPYKTYRTNILGALNVLDLCRRYKTKRIIIASSAHVYGNIGKCAKEEELPMPTRPYETSKTCIDIIAQSYADTYDLPVLIPRFVNIFGPGDTNFTRVIPKTIRNILNGQQPVLWGGKARREYLYIDDAIRAYGCLGQTKDSQIEKNRVYNFGTGKPITVKDLMEKIIMLTGKNMTIRHIPNQRKDEITLQCVSSVKAARVLGWESRVSLLQGLKHSIDWYKKYLKIKRKGGEDYD